MSNWTVFADLANQIDTTFVPAVNNVTDNLLSAAHAPFVAAATIYIAVLGYMIITGRMVEPMRDVWFKMLKLAAVASILTVGAYHQYVGDFFLTQIPADITGAITGSSGTVSAASFDHVWNMAYGAGLSVWNGLSMLDPGMAIAIVIYWLAAILSCATGFLVWFASHLILGLFIAVGPLVLPLYLFGATRSIAERWLGALLSMIFLQIFAVLMVTILLAAEGAMLKAHPLTTYVGLDTLFGAVVLFVIAALVMAQLPSCAVALAGGMHFHASAITRATFGRAGQAAGSIAGAGGRAITSAPARARAALAAPPARTTPPGPSMSTSREKAAA